MSHSKNVELSKMEEGSEWAQTQRDGLDTQMRGPAPISDMRQSRVDHLTRRSDSLIKSDRGLQADAVEAFVSDSNSTTLKGSLDDVGLNYYILKPIHYILFGNGENRFLIVPIVLAILMCTLFGLERSAITLNTNIAPIGQVILMNLGFLSCIVLWVALMYFGTAFCRGKQLTVVLVAAASCSDPAHKQRDFQQHVLNVLNYFYLASISFAVLACFPVILIAGSDFNKLAFSTALAASLYPYTNLVLLTVYQIIGSLWLWTVYVMYRTFSDQVVPNLSLDTLDKCEEVVISYTESLKRVSRDWKSIHIVRTLAGLFLGAFMAFETTYELHTAKNLANYPHYRPLRMYLIHAALSEGMSATGYFGNLWLGYFSAGWVNDHVGKILLQRIGDMLLNVDAYYKMSGNPNKMPLAEAKELLRNLVAIIPSRNIGLEVGGLTVGVEKAITLGTIFSYLISELISSIGFPPA